MNQSKLLVLLSLSFFISGCNGIVNDSSSSINEGLSSESVQSNSSTMDQTSDTSESSESGDKVEELNYLKSIFGQDKQFYTNDDFNPYGINLDKYGNDVYAIFYDDKISSTQDPYSNVNKNTFYSSYEKASSYEDAYYRTKHNLMSGDISPANYLPVSLNIKENDKMVRYSTAIYVLSTSGKYIAYLENNFDEFNLIYYNAAYASLNEVAAYLLAFGEVPANSKYNKNSSGKKSAVADWGKYGRVNDTTFSGNTSKYPYEPAIPTVRQKTFHETDFGTTGNYTLYNNDLGTSYNQSAYNNGSSITRGAARMIYTYDKTVTKIDDRYVFYTYNHYNDFQEYLNYHDGWGIRFGNESAGNGYCYNNDDYYASNNYPISKYPETYISRFNKK